MAGAKILLIDDDGAFGAQMKESCARVGWEVVVCIDGGEAVEVAERIRPTAFVVSAEVPRTSGYSLCNKFRKGQEWKERPLVMVSSTATEKTFEQHRKLRTRADEYFIKPCSAEEVVAKLRQRVGGAGGVGAMGGGLGTQQGTQQGMQTGGHGGTCNASMGASMGASGTASGGKKEGSRTMWPLALLGIGLAMFVVVFLYLRLMT